MATLAVAHGQRGRLNRASGTSSGLWRRHAGRKAPLPRTPLPRATAVARSRIRCPHWQAGQSAPYKARAYIRLRCSSQAGAKRVAAQGVGPYLPGPVTSRTRRVAFRAALAACWGPISPALLAPRPARAQPRPRLRGCARWASACRISTLIPACPDASLMHVLRTPSRRQPGASC